MALQERREQKRGEQEQAAPRVDLPRRSRAALVLGVAALVCAILAAAGPASEQRTLYSWPPSSLPAQDPERLWYTPLLLARHEPESLTARLPCTLPQPLPDAARPVTVLSTARDPRLADALSLTAAGDRLLVRIGERTLATARLAASAAGGRQCAYELRLGAGRWSLSGGPGGVSSGGTLEAMPIVAGLFSALDLRAGAAPSIEVTTVAHGAETRFHQSVLWIAAVLAAALALLLVAESRRPQRPWRDAVRSVRRAAGHLGLPDAVLASILLAWWVIGPVFFDDGWVASRQGNFSESGGFSAYFTSFGVNLPLGYWLEWLEHWLVEATSALLVLRLPALVALAATWALCRWVLARVAAASTGADRVALWALVFSFAVGALAWGMTLRPEPVVALLAAGVLASTVRFLERPAAGPIALAAVLVALALAAHPSGIVAIAPLLAAAPSLARWARRRPSAAATVLCGGGALLVTLATIGSDLTLRRADVQALRAFGDETAGWRDEIGRYAFLSQSPYGSPLRRESVALILLAVAAYLLRRRDRAANRLLDLPAGALGLALVLLVLTPTKWPWHFGTLVGMAAVAAAAETVRLLEDARSSRGWDLRPLLVVAAAAVVAAWSWNPRNAWGDLDLRTLDWTLAVESRITFSKLAAVLPVLVLAVLLLLELRHGAGRLLSAVPWRAASWTVPVVAAPLIGFTIAVLVADAIKTDSWTVARQNLQTLTRDLGCGLADDAVVAAPASMRALAPLDPARAPAAPPALPPPPVPDLGRFALGPAPSRSQPARSQWFRLPARPVGFFLTGVPGSRETLELEWGRQRAGRVERLAAEAVPGSFSDDAQPDFVAWRFYSAGDLPSPPPGATAIRFALRSDAAPGAVVGLTAPVTYANERLAAVLEQRAPTLALPNLLEYVPCVRQPRISGGTAEVPTAILAFSDSIWPLGAGTSPHENLPHLYALERLPLSDSPAPPGTVSVYAVNRRIPGAVVAPADARPA